MQWVTRLLGVVALAALIASALVVIPAFFFAHLPLTLLMTPIMLTLLPTLLLGLGLLPFLALLCWLACRVFRLRLDEAGVTLSLGPYQRAMLWLETRQTQAARLFGLPCVLMEGLARDARLRVPTGLIRDGESPGKALLAFTPRIAPHLPRSGATRPRRRHKRPPKTFRKTSSPNFLKQTKKKAPEDKRQKRARENQPEKSVITLFPDPGFARQYPDDAITSPLLRYYHRH